MMEKLVLTQILFYILGGLSGFFQKGNPEHSNRLACSGALLAGLAGMFYSAGVLWSGNGIVLIFPGGIPLCGEIILKLDSLSAFFVFLISFLSIPVSIFAVGYNREYFGKKNMAIFGLFYNIFLLSMILVVMARNVLTFLVAWEVMSLVSYLLVVTEHENPKARRAGLMYFVMTHAGTAFIAGAFWLLFSVSGSLAFDAFRAHAGMLSSGLKNIIFLCALVGFGTKAGMIPFHIWLPEAHPEAPSPISALMSGAMIKTAIYALLRFLFFFLGPVPFWWGAVVLGIGILSTLLGVLYALMEHDLKRLLAFHSIENIGIILLGIGMGAVFVSTRQPVYASFAIAAALYHALNHATFKGLLFLGAGSVLSGTHTRNIEELGGLIRKMPWTAACFLTGSAAISALPPLNGFVSEWMTFLALLAGMDCGGFGIRFFSLVLASLLGLAGALAATCFVKAFGITFLGLPRSSHAEQAREGGRSMKIGMGTLALSCLGLGLAAPGIVSILGKLSGSLTGMSSGNSLAIHGSFLVFPSGWSQLSLPWIFAVLAVSLSAVVAGVIIFARRVPVKTGPSWACGMRGFTGRMQYSATGYSKPIRRVFSFLYQPSRKVEIEDEGYSVLRTAKRFESGIKPLFEETIYRPMTKFALYFSEKAKRIQTGHIQIYLGYIFITLIVLLLFARLS